MKGSFWHNSLFANSHSAASGCGISRCARHSTLFHHRDVSTIFVAETFGKTKINDENLVVLSFGTQDKIAGFDILRCEMAKPKARQRKAMTESRPCTSFGTLIFGILLPTIYFGGQSI